MASLRSGLKSAGKKLSKTFGSGKLEKACVVTYKKTGRQFKIDTKQQVQFNPSEYTIRRGVKLSSKKPLGKDSAPSSVQAVYGEPSVLAVTLYFDSYTELKSGEGLAAAAGSKVGGALKSKFNELKPKSLPSFDMNEESSPDVFYTVNKLFDDLLSTIKYAYEEHEPPYVGFVWGDHLHFVGKIRSYNVQYTMFDRDGTPVRAKLSLVLVGEEMALTMAEILFPNESPDRTKQRTLHYGDQLWMMALNEYGDPAHWKTIAQANGILNPREAGGVRRLKVPPIR